MNICREADVHAYDVINAIETRLSSQRAICTVRCSPSFGKVEVFKNRSTLPRHVVVYDADIILRYIKDLGDNSKLDLDILTKKMCTLLCLITTEGAGNPSTDSVTEIWRVPNSCYMWIGS